MDKWRSCFELKLVNKKCVIILSFHHTNRDNNKKKILKDGKKKNKLASDLYFLSD
jgi:hypothetical protein